MTRAFVAVRPPDDVLDAVAAVTGALDVGDDARRTTRDQWHVTLQFLGNHADVDAVAGALEGFPVASGVAQLGGLGAFPNERRARVAWIGLATGVELFAALAREVGVRLAPLGLEPEARPFHAHLTLARYKTPTDVRGRLAGADEVGLPWSVTEIVVYESRLQRSGAEYVARAPIPLRDP